jgi:polyisoprenoid-binding protein YceI
MNKFLIFFLLLILPTSVLSASTELWIIDKSKSSITFSIKVLFGKDIKGEFKNFEGYVKIDANNSIEHKAFVDVYTDSIIINYKKYNLLLKGPLFFDTEKHTKAILLTEEFIINTDNSARSQSILNIKDNIKMIDIPFNYKLENEDIAFVDGKFSFNRSDFNIGTGVWSSALILKNKVNMEIDLVLKKQ